MTEELWDEINAMIERNEWDWDAASHQEKEN